MGARQYSNNPPPHLLPSFELITTMTLLFFLIYPSDVSSLSFNDKGFKKDDPTLRLKGDADYDGNGCLNLTKLEKDSIGRVAYSENLHLSKSCF
ncbi:hypothetical protein K1719_018568 [Acacia pycnantha]|nr:hypothetical protein K1719_018568 [Acacia pycnantha]